jgi:hypothetical protein
MTTQDQAWIALYSLHYQGEWNRYQLASPSALGPLYKPLEADEAVTKLVTYNGPKGGFYRRLAIAAICRGAGSPTLALGTAQNLIGKLANYELLQPQIPAFNNILTYPQSQYKKRFADALKLAIPTGCGLLDFTYTATFCLSALVSDVEVQATVGVPAANLAASIDPQLWQQDTPEIWDVSEVVGIPQEFVDRNAPPLAGNRQGPAKWSSPFFEQAKWVSGGSTSLGTLGTFRNILFVKYAPTQGHGARFDFRLVECLSTDYVFQTAANQGGIDRDSGFGEVAPDPTNAAQCIVTAKKSLRFTQPVDLLLPANETAFINVLVLLEWLVALAACNAGPARP